MVGQRLNDLLAIFGVPLFVHVLLRDSLSEQPVPLHECDVDGAVCETPRGFDDRLRVRQQVFAANVFNRLIEQSKNRIQTKITEMENDGIFGETDFYAITKSQVYNNFYTRISNIINE